MENEGSGSKKEMINMKEWFSLSSTWTLGLLAAIFSHRSLEPRERNDAGSINQILKSSHMLCDV